MRCEFFQGNNHGGSHHGTHGCKFLNSAEAHSSCQVRVHVRHCIRYSVLPEGNSKEWYQVFVELQYGQGWVIELLVRVELTTSWLEARLSAN